MSTTTTGQPLSRKIGAIRRREVSLEEMPLVNARPLTPGESFVRVYEPITGDVDVVGWMANNREQVEQDLQNHGALLLHGFDVKSAADFERVTRVFFGKLYGGYGDLPRAGTSANIYQSTPYPPDKAILFHNESSHLDSWPMRIGFHCVRKAAVGGSTPLLDCREVCRRLDPAVLSQFVEKGVMYVRNFSEGIDVNWRQFFQTDNRDAVETACRNAGVDFEWTKRDGLRTRQKSPAVARHPRTSELVFFNQVQLHHVTCLDNDTRESLLSVFGEEYLPRSVYFGDGSPIPDSAMQHVGEVFEELAVRSDWDEGDIVLLDNMLTAHARDPYQGERKIVVAMGQMFSKKDLPRIA